MRKLLSTGNAFTFNMLHIDEPKKKDLSMDEPNNS